MEKILVIGAGGQIGVELTLALRARWGIEQVIATDIKPAHPLLVDAGPYAILDVMKSDEVERVIIEHQVTQIYLMAAILSATGEKNPLWAWDINMQSLLSVLELSVKHHVKRVFWPSSIAVFGTTTPRLHTPQKTVIEPSTVYGISKYAGELWMQYYYDRYGLDIRSIRYPGIISWKSAPGGGTTDYAIDIYIEALSKKSFECFLAADTTLPMAYMDDAIRATIELMDAPRAQLKNKLSYNVSGISFAPQDIAAEIQKRMPDFTITYNPDYRQDIASSWPESIDDSDAKNDWGWQPEYDLSKITDTMLYHLARQ